MKARNGQFAGRRLLAWVALVVAGLTALLGLWAVIWSLRCRAIAAVRDSVKAKNAETRMHYLTVLSQSPDNVHALIQLGVFTAADQDYEKAVGYYERCLEIDSENETALVYIALAHFEMFRRCGDDGQKRLQLASALRYAREAKSVLLRNFLPTPKRIEHLEFCAKLLEAGGAHGEALACLTSALTGLKQIGQTKMRPHFQWAAWEARIRTHMQQLHQADVTSPVRDRRDGGD